MARTVRRELLSRLLDAHERSVFYGKPAPWRRDVIVRLDAKSFPEAFSPAGRAQREALFAAAERLEEDRITRMERHARGPLRGEAKALRLGPEELAAAEAAGAQEGFVSLSSALVAFVLHFRALEAGSRPAWFRDWIRTGCALLESADTGSFLGMGRPRFKRLVPELKDASTAAAHLSEGVPESWERVISERMFRDSKRIAAVRAYVVSMLVRADPRWEGVPPEEATDLLEAYGVRRKPGLIRCAGVAHLRVGERTVSMEDFAPAAHLPDAWSDAWIAGVAAAAPRILTTVENEYPFLSYIDERGGPAGLGRDGELVVYTAGFPTPALVRALAGLVGARKGMTVRHWGDADVGGLRIWNFLRTRLATPIHLFRTTGEWVRAEAREGGRALSGIEKAALSRMKSQLTASGEIGPDVQDAVELIDALLATGTKLEQERY